ncbi:MAG: methyltransferase domain-containing protein [Nitrospirae bacterium]|nr:MAG: methyltransferase domain-containing protein [Nitrospirota bacterium]
MMQSKPGNLDNRFPSRALLFIGIPLLFSLLSLSSSCSHYPHHEGGGSPGHLPHAEGSTAETVSQPHVHHAFKDAELWSKRFDAPDRKDWQKPEEVIELMDIESGMTVADIGAGTGYFLGYLSKAVGAQGMVLGLDIEPSMVDFMANRAKRENWTNVEVRVVHPDDPGLPPNSVDRILIVNTWHHIADREHYSRKLYDALKPGGKVLVVDFTLESPHGPPVSQRLRPEEVMAELQAGGFEVELLQETLPNQYIVAGHHPPERE